MNAEKLKTYRVYCYKASIFYAVFLISVLFAALFKLPHPRETAVIFGSLTTVLLFAHGLRGLMSKKYDHSVSDLAYLLVLAPICHAIVWGTEERLIPLPLCVYAIVYGVVTLFTLRNLSTR